jgi:uncharacterized membrane protein
MSQLHRGDGLRKELFDLIKSDFPDFKEDSYISNKQLNEYRKKYMKNLLLDEDVEISALQKEVIESIGTDKLLSENVDELIDEKYTMGERLADKVAEFGGSWFFIIFFFSFILVWMIVNSIILLQKAYDPYPFILLNLILSCLAAIQAPIIMMSQNRQEIKDRKRAESDYKVNLKAELEIKLLHEKIDHMIQHQNKRLLEIQELQTEYLNDIMKNMEKKEK